ncbi:O-antigen ligase family protein [Photobacterium sp. BZF1]|uniref:O-antigen ligase family protein n=1 Tax=Photobacterium sp. BZF1 TaxID=1904457 RepID=UPI001653C386|nr:O-antigen ligase family protein [Photobacterium sp. BZF1]MBC7005670.1 O-antigen ligase family protein [Photobacterium sp. BZF1]
MRLNQISFYSMLVLLVWLPIPLASNRIWAWSIAELWVALTTLTLVLSYRTNWQAFPFERIKRFGWLLVPLGLFQVWTAFQLIPFDLEVLKLLSPFAAEAYENIGADTGRITVNAYATVSGLLKGLTYLLFALCAVVLIDSKQRVKQVLGAIVVSGTFQAFYGAMVVLLGIEYSLVFGIRLPDVATGSFVYKNHLANYLMLCLSLGTGLLIAQLHVSASGSWHERIKRWVSGMMSAKMFVRCVLVVMVIALVMTRSRMGNTAFFAATTIGGLVALLFYRNKPRVLVALIISILVVDTFVVGSIFGLVKVKQRLEQTTMSNETRDEVVQWSMDIIEKMPLTGTGLGSFHSTFPAFSKANIGYYDHAHNDYIQFAVETGIPATLLLGSSCLFAIWLCVKTIRQRSSKTLKGTALGCLMAVVGMLIHISVDFNLQPTANAMTFILVLVLAGCSAHLPKGHSG